MLALLLLVLLLLAAWLYSWTFTPHGRIQFLPALICRVAALAARFSADMAYDESERASANRSTVKLLALPPTPEVATEDETLSLPGRQLKLRWYRPVNGAECPVVLNIHGGAWWMGSDFIDDAVMRHLCRESSCVILSVDYRLAPEHVFPAALEDCYEALLHLRDRAQHHGGDAARLGLHGTSAGGGLAAGLCLLSQQRGGPDIGLQALIVPVTDLSGEHAGASMADFAHGYVLDAADLEQMIANYVPDETLRRDPLVSPIYAEDLATMPPTMVATAEFDPLRDQGEAFADALASAGVDAVKHRYPGTIHGFFGSKQVLRAVITETARELRARL